MTRARRDVYKTVNRMDLFPLPFCKTCWVEDKNVAAGRIVVWSYLIEFIKAAATAYNLIKLDVFDKNIRLPLSSVKLTTATEAFLSSKGISASEKSNF